MLSPLRARAPANVERAALIACVSLLAAAAWLSLSLSGDSGFFHLHHLSHPPAATFSFLLFFVVNWVVMTVAMMLPTSLPVIVTLHAFAGRRSDRWLLVALVVLGYLTAWAFFGVAACFGYFLWQGRADVLPWLAAGPPSGAPLLLLVAGAFQFSSLKYRCLDKCRSPLSFVVEHWHGSRERREAFRLGLDHGIFCVGCCWALMLLMFAVGAGSLVWMFVLAVVMAVEKNISWGRTLSIPIGIVFLAWGTLLLILQ